MQTRYNSASTLFLTLIFMALSEILLTVMVPNKHLGLMKNQNPFTQFLLNWKLRKNFTAKKCENIVYLFKLECKMASKGQNQINQLSLINSTEQERPSAPAGLNVVKSCWWAAHSAKACSASLFSSGSLLVHYNSLLSLTLALSIVCNPPRGQIWSLNNVTAGIHNVHQ